MQAKHAERALRLVDALDTLNAIKSRLAEKKKNFAGDGYRAFEISVVSDVSEAGSSTEAYTVLPLEFGEAILPEIERLLLAELNAIGVEP